MRTIDQILILMLVILTLAALPAQGARESLRPYLGVQEMTCAEVQAEIQHLADRIDKRELANNVMDGFDALVTGAVAAGTLGVAYAVVPQVTAGLRLPYSQILTAIEYRAEYALKIGCKLPVELMEVE